MKKIIKINIPKGYEFAGVDDNAQQIVFQKIRPQYPKTYEECCEVLKTTRIHIEGLGLDEVNRIKPFIQLLRCRDAYWKIAGEQMGLGKSWEPDWSNAAQRKYCIVNTEGNVLKWVQKTTNKILAFPTEEMQNVFYENFKDLIEHCKEFL